METEAKFTVPGEAAFARLRGTEQFGKYTRRDERTKEVHDRYLDTPGRNFLNNGWCLRLRKGKEGDLLITIKGLERKALSDGAEAGSIAAREEYETSVPALTLNRWPDSEAKTLAKALAGRQPLRDLVSVSQVRTISRLYDEDRAVAELSLDEVKFQGPGNGDPIPLHYELEAELLPDGTIADVRALSAIFAEEYGLDPQPLSKFEQALLVANPGSRKPTELTVPDYTAEATAPSSDATPTPKKKKKDRPADATPQQQAEPLPSLETPAPKDQSEVKNQKSEVRVTDPMGLAGRKVIALHFEAMLANEEGSRLGEDPEAVHDMRVATRRMRAAMRVFAESLESKRAKDVRDGLRDTARALGAVRDLDVLIGNVDDFRESLPADRQQGLPGMIEEWRVKRWKARKALIRHLDSKEFSSFKREMDKFLDEEISPPDQTEGAQPYQVRHRIGNSIIEHYEAVRAFEALPDEPTITQIHALRIAGKYFRYTLEFFRDALPKDASAMIRDITRLQDNLGELHDADVASTLVRDYLGARNQDDMPPGIAAYLAHLQAIMDARQKEYVATWADLQSPEWRKRLAALVV